MHMKDFWDKYLCEDRRRKSSAASHREENKDYRNEYESDLSRVIFSSAARRMHDKTQVIPLTYDDNVHSRLTHSLEVMTIGESIVKGILMEMGKKEYGDDKDKVLAYYNKYHNAISGLIRTVCLAHDIGNPPFGHFGETVITDFFNKEFSQGKCWDKYNEWKNDFTQYDGNAQGFRVLTKLQCLNDLFGLNCTYSSLASYLKYPNSGKGDENSSRIECHKHGVFGADWEVAKEALEKTACLLREEGGETRYIRHPLSYVMEAADSICYLSMDIEDAYQKGWVSVEDIFDTMQGGVIVPQEDEDFWKKFFVIRDQNEGEKLSIKDRLETQGRDKIVHFRVGLIQYFSTLAIDNFVANVDKIESGKYNKELIKHDDKKVAKCLGKYSVKNIYSQKENMMLEMTGKSVISGLLRILADVLFHSDGDFRKRGKSLISASVLRANLMDFKSVSGDWYYDKDKKAYFKKDIEEGDEKLPIDIDKELDGFDVSSFPDYFKYRVIVDYVSGMTDKFAVSLYQELSGMAL